MAAEGVVLDASSGAALARSLDAASAAAADPAAATLFRGLATRAMSEVRKLRGYCLTQETRVSTAVNDTRGAYSLRNTA